MKSAYPDIPVIGFPRNAADKAVIYAENTDIQAVGLDFSVSPAWARDNLQTICPVQGNLDPVTLLTGGQVMKDAAQNILETFADKPFIFNLGHGVIKETPPEHVAQLSDIIRNFKK